VGKVVERVLEHEKEGNLPGDRPERGEGDRVGRHAEILSHRMEAPDLRARTKARQQWGQGRRERRTRGEGRRTWGSSTVKCERRTSFVQSHCCLAVGTLPGCNFHLLK
jgi:hypothetical protein